MRQAGIAQGGADGYSLFIVEKGMEGFRVGQQLKGKCGMRGSATAELVFEQVWQRLPCGASAHGRRNPSPQSCSEARPQRNGAGRCSAACCC